MDRGARHRKSRSASGVEGNRLILKQKAVSRLSSDSHSYIDWIHKDDMLEQRSTIQATGMPMKKLLAAEMSKEIEPRKRPPSVIARLMGLEGLPSPRHVNRQENRSSDCHQQKNVSVDVQLSSQIHGSQLNRRSSMYQQEFKDVYENLEAPHVINHRCSSRWNARSIPTKPDMSLIQQNFPSTKRPFTCKKLRDSGELHDALEMLGRNKDLLLKFLEQPDSLVQKHSNCQVDSNSSYGSRIAVLTPFNSDKYESNAKAWRSERYGSSKLHAPYLKHENGLLLEADNCYRAHQSRNPSTFLLEESNEENILPTRIVVLKPNLGKMRNTGTSYSLADLSHACQSNCQKIREYPNVGSAGKVSRKYSSHDKPRPMSKEARDIVSQISLRMKEGWEKTADARSTTFRGYIGDESSYEANESESESDNEFYRCPSSSFGESSLSREAKMRLSERWKMTHRYQNLEMVSKGSTLAEMLALPDRGARPTHVAARSGLGREGTRLAGNTSAAAEVGHLGISSTDVWKDETSRNSSRSRSLPPSPVGLSYQRCKYHVELTEDKHLLRCGRTKVVEGNLSSKEDYSSKDSKSRGKNTHFCQRLIADEIDSSSEGNFDIQMEVNTTDLSLPSSFESSAKEATCKSPIVDVIIVPEPGSISLSLTSLELLAKQSSFDVKGHQFTPPGNKDSSFQELLQDQPKQGSRFLKSPGAEIDTYESFKEVDHPSPVSVLEVPCSEDGSPSESFERVNTELHELRKQLRFLKLESGTELFTLLPIEEEIAQLSPTPTVSEENFAIDANGWQTCYAVDLLIDSGLEEFDFSICGAMWHYPESPLDPKLFDNLEKKYKDERMGSKPERKLLFDRINSTLLEIFRTHVDSFPWVMPTLSVPYSKWDKQVVRDTIEKLMIQDFSNWEISERELDGEMHWSNPKVEMDVIGREIEKLLIDDLILDVYVLYYRSS